MRYTFSSTQLAIRVRFDLRSRLMESLSRRTPRYCYHLLAVELLRFLVTLWGTLIINLTLYIHGVLGWPGMDIDIILDCIFLINQISLYTIWDFLILEQIINFMMDIKTRKRDFGLSSTVARTGSYIHTIFVISMIFNKHTL